MKKSANEGNISDQYRDNKLISERSNTLYPIGSLNEKNFTENTQRDSKNSSSRKETFIDHKNHRDSYSMKNYKDNVNIISDRPGIDKNDNMNTYGNKDDRRANDDFSNTNKDFNKYEISKTSSNTNANFGMSSSNSTKFDKRGKGTDKIKFSNVNNLEFFNQKYYK